MNAIRISTVLLALVFFGAATVAEAQTVVTTNVTTDTTWGGAANPSPIVLDGPVFVIGATLTILPGTIVRGQPRSAAVVIGSTVGTPGLLVVTQTGRLIADASASNPIIMTTAAVDNNSDGIADDVVAPIGFEDKWTPGDAFLDAAPKTTPLAPLNPAGDANVALWGGLVILGNAPTNNANKAAVGYGKGLIEGLTVPGFPASQATYGGLLPHDNSGVIRYVSVRHAGDELGADNELNGVSLGGVGDGTTLEFVEVYCNFDDGFEWFGGTVNGSHLTVAFVGDDMFDADEGYTGVNQFLFGIMPFFNTNSGAAFGSGSGDKACEFDGDNYRPDSPALFDNVNVRLDVTQSVLDTTPWPLSRSTWWNMTLIGSTPDAGQEFTPTSPASVNRGIQMRNGFAGEVYNSIVVNTGTRAGFEIDPDLGDGAPGFDSIDNVNNGLIALVSSTLDDGAAPAAAALTGIANGDALNTKLGGTANVVNAGGFLGLENEDTTFNPIGVGGKLTAALKASKIDPRPKISLVGTTGGVPPSGSGLDPSATYRGAFPIGVPLWTDAWTALSIAGLL